MVHSDIGRKKPSLPPPFSLGWGFFSDLCTGFLKNVVVHYNGESTVFGCFLHDSKIFDCGNHAVHFQKLFKKSRSFPGNSYCALSCISTLSKNQESFLASSEKYPSLSVIMCVRMGSFFRFYLQFMLMICWKWLVLDITAWTGVTIKFCYGHLLYR